MCLIGYSITEQELHPLQALLEELDAKIKEQVIVIIILCFVTIVPEPINNSSVLPLPPSVLTMGLNQDGWA